MSALQSEDFHPTKILVVDDSAFDRARARRVINSARIRCLIVEADSIQALQEAMFVETFDIAVLDYDLPDGTGLDALRLIQGCGRNSQLVSIMVTGNESPHVAQSAAKYGCTSVLFKPGFCADALIQAIVSGLRNQSGRNEFQQENTETSIKLSIVSDKLVDHPT